MPTALEYLPELAVQALDRVRRRQDAPQRRRVGEGRRHPVPLPRQSSAIVGQALPLRARREGRERRLGPSHRLGAVDLAQQRLSTIV